MECAAPRSQRDLPGTRFLFITIGMEGILCRRYLSTLLTTVPMKFHKVWQILELPSVYLHPQNIGVLLNSAAFQPPLAYPAQSAQRHCCNRPLCHSAGVHAVHISLTTL